MAPTDLTTPAASPPAFFLEDMGCQMNRLDSELVAGRLHGSGFRRVEDRTEADVILYYTCSVREHAEDKVYGRLGALKRLKRERPGLVIGVMGCMAQNHKDLIFERAPHVDLVVGTNRFEDVVSLLDEVRHGRRVIAVDEKELSFDRDVSLRPRRSQAFLTAMRGCDKFCTFCIVPYTQGRERSRPLADLVEEAKRLADDGVVDLTVLGQRIDTYGLDLDDGTTLAKLLARLHEEVPGFLRITFITSHPNHMTEELARTVADHPRISRYLHLPVQSGSDRVLKEMNRGYTVADYRKKLDLMRRFEPRLSVATDWIVGFPGESEADFEASRALLRDADFQTSFVFKYSPRAGTRAFDREDDVPTEEKERRNQTLLEDQRAQSLARNRPRLGTEVDALVEGPSKSDPDRWTARTDQNLIVHFPAGRDLVGRLVRVRLLECSPVSFIGELV
ncbi:MAG TPA: tRNA (N6-isopentenyl adenosine(37)-C2)-methylthiotransferase MiaB [Planctomycetota bacterium]|nr:tRNA (N6-isopentenyl adenosine(37)-C2)-methylthiotransferase MiaB [Planctomycetota bacterium]